MLTAGEAIEMRKHLGRFDGFDEANTVLDEIFDSGGVDPEPLRALPEKDPIIGEIVRSGGGI